MAKSTEQLDKFKRKLATQIGSMMDMEIGKSDIGDDEKIGERIGIKTMPPPEPRIPVTVPAARPAVMHLKRMDIVSLLTGT